MLADERRLLQFPASVHCGGDAFEPQDKFDLASLCLLLLFSHWRRFKLWDLGFGSISSFLVDAQANLAPEVEDILMEFADNFIDSASHDFAIWTSLCGSCAGGWAKHN